MHAFELMSIFVAVFFFIMLETILDKYKIKDETFLMFFSSLFFIVIILAITIDNLSKENETKVEVNESKMRLIKKR